MSGRRRLIAIGLPAAAVLVVTSYSLGGSPMWISVVLAGIVGGMAFPALAVYRTELFPTGLRSSSGSGAAHSLTVPT